MSINSIEADLVVIGAGPGGYTAAFHAADIGLNVVLVEKHKNLGGVCLNVGCIPSKALLHMAAFKDEATEMEEAGLSFGKPKIDLKKVRSYKESVIGKMTAGLKQLSKMRNVRVLQGNAFFDNDKQITVTGDEKHKVSFKNVIIATGSSPIIPKPFQIESDRVMTSTGALALKDIPKKLLVVGGGVIGLEMSFIYSSLGSEVKIIEATDEVAMGVDKDLKKILVKKMKEKVKEIHTGTMLSSLEDKNKTILAKYTKDSKEVAEEFDRVLLSIGRRPNSSELGLENILKIDEKGFIVVDEQMRTSCNHIFAIGDVVGNPMLAHKGSSEGHVAVEAILGKKTICDFKGIPSVIYTEPEVAWVGLTEEEAKQKKIEYKVGSFPWAASGRATAVNKKEGLTKILFEPETERVLGVGIVGLHAGELISEGCLALEMSAVVGDITGTIHAHPTLSETFLESAEALHGVATHIYARKNR